MPYDKFDQLYDALKADGAVSKSRENFRSKMLAPGAEGYQNRRQLFDALKADGVVESPTYEEFAKRLGLHAVESAQQPTAADAATPEQPKATSYFKLRRGGKDFTVSTDEVNAAGGLYDWAKAHPGAPLRVYMQGTNENGKPFDGHVDLSVAHDRSKKRGYKYITTDKPVETPPQKPWKPTKQQKMAMSFQLQQLQQQSDAFFEQSRERIQNMSDYYRSNRSLGFQTVEGKPVFNPETGKMEKTYLTPTGDRTTSKAAADMETMNYRRAMAAADMSVGAQIRRSEAELAELRRQLNESSERVYKEWEKDYKENTAPLAAVLASNTYVPRQQADKENSALRVAIRQKEEQLKDLYEERDRQMGKDVGFWRGFGRTMTDFRTWDFGISDLSDAMTMMNADKYSAPDATEGEKRAGQEMLRAIHDRDQTEQMYGGNASFWNRAGVMTGYMPSFMLDFALTGGGFDAINVGGKIATRGAVNLVGKEAIEEMTKLGIKAYAKKYGVRGVGRMAENWTIKALGTTADDLLIRAPLMTNTIQGASTAADIIDRKLGDVVIDENGNYDFSSDKTWGSAVWQGEANSIIDNYSEMFGTHLDGVVPSLAKTFGGKRISGMLARANASGYGQILATTRKQFERLGVSDYFGEVSEEYYGQLWRSMLNLDDAYTNVPVLDKDGNQVLDAQGNPVYERKNLLLTGQFHGDIWGGMALSMGLMGAGKYSISGIAYGNMKHHVNKADKRAAEIFTPDRWEPIRELIDNTTNEDIGVLAENMVNDQNLSDNERSAVMEYMERSLNLRGLNLGAMAKSRGTAEGDEALPENIEVDSELSQSYIDGYEASSPQEMNDAQNMYEFHRQRVEGMFEPDMLDWFDSDPATALIDMSRNGLFSQEEIDSARDYINAKTVRDGILQRVNDNIDEQIAQSDAMINGRINPATSMIQPVLMGLDDRQVYVVGGALAVNPDGTIDRDASDESIVVRDAQTGELEFTDPKSIVSALEEMDPEMERAAAVDNIRQQAAQAAANAMNGTLAFNPGDVVTINDGGELVQCTIVGPLIDESTGKPAEDLLDVRFPDGSQIAFTKEQLQQSVDALNRERIEGVDRERTAARAQQRAAEAEAMRPKFALNDEFTILNDAGIPIRGSVTSEIDEDGTVEIYTEEPINGNKVNHFTPAELEEMIDTYNGSPTQDVSTEEAVLSEEDSLTLPTDNDTDDGYGNGPQQDNDGSAGNDSGTVARDAAGSVASNRDRSTIRSYEEGLAAHQYAHTDDSERNRREKESERLVGIAKANGQYFDRDRKSVVGTKNAKSTGESEVYVDKDGKKIYKVKDPYAKSPMKGDVQPEDVIYEHLVHNKYFPETAYGFEGISDDMGDVRIVLSQDYVESVGQPTTEQIESALAEKGLLPEGRYTYGNEEISVTDVTGDNALLGADGKVYFIDPIINFKKPVKEILGETEESPQEEITALQRIPRDAEGRPDYEAADTETAWDALVESAKGNEERAKRVAEGMVKQKRTELERVKKLTPPNPGKGKYLSPEELIEWEESHDAMTEGAEAALAKWIAVGRVQQDRQAAAKKAADEERQRQAAELWEQQKEQQRQEEAARKTAEAEAEARRSEIAAQQAIAEKEAAERRDSHIGKAESAFDEYLQQLRDNVVSRHITPEYRKQMEREDRAKGPSQYASMYANWESPQSLEEYIARVLSTNDKRVKWSGAGNLAGELYGQEKMSERKEHSWMTSDTNGMSFAKFIHGIWEGLIGENGVSFNNHVYTDQDVRNAVIDALRSNPTSRGLYEQALNMHRSNGNDNMQLRSELDELLMHEDEIRDEWYNEHFHMSAEEYEAAEEQMLASIRESGITDEDICAMASETIDEYINSNYYGTERNQGSNQVLPAAQADDTIGGEEAVGGRPEASGGTSIDDDAAESGIANTVQPTEAQKAAGKNTEPMHYDSQGNPIGEDGNLIIENVKSVDDITDADFTNPTRTVGLPPLPSKVSDAIGGEGRKPIIKRNILNKNRNSHKDLTPADSRKILKEVLYNPDLSGQNQKAQGPYNWILVHLADKNSSVILEVNPTKDSLEIVNWHYLNGRQLEQKKRQAEREGGRILTLQESNAAGDTSLGLSSGSKDNALSTDKQADSAESSLQSNQTGEANLADFSTPVNSEEAKPETDKPVNPSGNKLVTDERYAELRERMRKKLGGQFNMGVDPEILAIGTEMAVYHIEKGARKFKAYASAMIVDLGDAIRPYLKAFYNAVRDMPEAEAAGLVADMDSYDEVRNVDIANFDKPGTDAMATAAAVVAEQEAESQKAEAERKLQAYRHLVNKYAQDIANSPMFKKAVSINDSENVNGVGIDLYKYYVGEDITSIAENSLYQMFTDQWNADDGVLQSAILAEAIRKAHKAIQQDNTVVNPDGTTTETVVEDGTEIAVTTGDFIPGVKPTADNEKKPGGKKKPGKLKPRPTTDGGLFDTVEDETASAPSIIVPEPRPAADLMGDSSAYQDRGAQTAELVEEIGGVIESRVMMLQLDAESVKPLTMTEVKKMASKYSALNGISDTDLQELVELAMTQLTRSEAIIKIDGTAEQQRAAFDHIVNLYQIQPSLNARDSERLIKQQYSTPTPFGYVMGQFVRAGGKTVGSMLEPSAGNGALTITVHPSLVHVNDIDEARLANLRKLGYAQVTAQDALLPFGGDKVDVVMTNPPFGTVAEKEYDGVFHISSLEGQMAINALEQMKDDGRAAIVIGGNTSYRTNGSMNPKDAAFFGYLYSHYNVADVINISGKALYSRNGTGYDVRMILIDGRKTGDFQRIYPPVKAKARAEQIKTFDELYKRVQDDIQQIQQVGSPSVDVQREPESTTDGTASAPIRSGSNHPDSGAGQRPGTTSDAVRDTPRTDSGQPTPGNVGIRSAGVDNADSGNAGGTDNVQRSESSAAGRGKLDKGVGDGRGRSGNDGHNAATFRPDNNRQRLAVKTGLGEEKVPYPNQSENGFTLLSVVPAAQAQVLQKSLGEIGDVDQYLVDELGYSSKDELYGYLAAEQIDSVALAIHQMNKGNAFIIGDMTGVGKGRQGAALIRYAVKQGKVPIYFTQKPTLFTDNYRDLVDIGSSNMRPFIMASVDKERSGDIVDSDGKVVYKIPSKKEKNRVYNYILKNGSLPPEYDYVLTTYSQIQNGTHDYAQNEDGRWNIEARKLPRKSKGYTPADHNGQTRRNALAKLAEGNITILDESHTVGGDSGCGRYMQMLTSQAGGVTFLSATFAKRADNMPIYAQRTAIAEAGVKASELIGAIMKGGVTLQEIMSKQLVESGQMIRRERSFEGVTIDWLSVEEETDRRQRAQFDEVAAIFNAIRNFQDDYITPIIDAKNEAAAEWGATVGHTQGTKDMGVKNVPFASKMYNLVNQLLFALKVDAVADRVVENLRNGYKPVISFTNTMEGFLSSAPKGVAMDDVPNFSLTLMRALDGVMRFTEKDADENTEGGSISLSELSAEGQKSYNAIRDKIMNLAADLPISPMDAIRMKIEEAGYSVAEITGRTMQLNRTEDGKYIVEARKDRDKKAAMRDFNSGKLDVLMINKSGSTGISLHASSKFEDQRQRVMVFAQFQSDINDEVQMRGRIDRSGQVTRGRYEYIMSTIPAEQRIQMMFKAKLKSLDANTTSSQKSKFNEMEIVDYLNKYGDEVVWEYMKEHPELEERLGDPLDMLQEKNSEDGPRTSEKEDTSKKTGCAGKISRYLAFLSVDEQDEIFKEITEAYRVKIQLLDDAGENDLEITTMPLRAETKRKQIWHEGVNPGSGNAFADNTYVEEVDVDVLKKPMKRDEIIEATRKLAGNLYAERNGAMDWEHYTYNKGEEIHQFYQSKADETFGKMKEAGEVRIAKAREKAVAAAIKARGRGENNFTDAEIQSLADTVANEEREKEEQKQNKRHNEIMAVNNRIQALLTRLRAGSIYVVPQDLKQGTPEMFSQTFGTFVGFKFNKSYTLGSSTAIFATLDGRRKVELALSDPAINTIISATEIAYRYSPKEINAITMENWDSNVPTQTRQKRYIITGNLLQALVDTEKGEKTRGNLISYSTIDEETRQGILMGENFKLTDLRNSASLSSRLAQIREGKAVVSENGDVQISKEIYDWRHRGEYELRVPKSKQRGGIYTMHSGLLKLVEGNNFITNGNNMVAYVTEENIANVVDMLSRAPFNLTVLQKSQLSDADNLERMGDGYGAYSDGEVSYMNDPISKVLGKNRFSKKRQAEFAARERQRMITRVRELANVMHLDNVDIVTDASGLDGKRAKAKGFYNKRTDRITIVIPNNVSTIDAVQTLLHEAVAHYGLRQLFGKQFDTFLDNVYQAADEGIRRRIAEMAAKNGWDFRTATEEYLAELAESTDFRESQYEGGWWDKVKRLFMEMLELIGFADFKEMGVVLTDNELRYLLWRSYANLSEPGRYRSILGEAADVAKQSELRVGNYAPIADDVAKASEATLTMLANDRFNEQLEMYLAGKLPHQEYLRVGMPHGVMKGFLPELPIVMRQRILSKASETKHNVELTSLMDLPSRIATPIFIFQRDSKTIGVLTEIKDREGKNVCIAIELNRSIQDGGDYLEVNDVRSVHGRDVENTLLPIIHNNTLRYVDKKKGLAWLSSASSNYQQEIAAQDLDSAAKIIKEFENPSIEDDNILFRSGGTARDEYDRRVRTKIVDKENLRSKGTNRAGQLNEAYLDSMRSLKVLQEAISHETGRPVDDFENAYMAENQMSSRNKIQEETYQRDFFKPLCKAVAEVCKGKKEAYRELLDYLIAKHGLERNAYMRAKAIADGTEQAKAGTTDYSGLTALFKEKDVLKAEQAAEKMVSDYEATHKTNELWMRINAATAETLRRRYQGGLLSKDMYLQISSQYKHYIPLKGWDDATAMDIYEYAAGGYGLSPALMTAHGRRSVADDPLANIMVDAQRTIMEANRNVMKQKFLNLALNHPTSLLSISRQWYVKQADGTWLPDNPIIPEEADADTVDVNVKQHEADMIALEAQGMAKTIRKGLRLGLKNKYANKTQHVVKVKRNGETFCIYVNGDPRAARAINGMLNPDSDQKTKFAKLAQEFKNFMAKTFTTWNPEFVVGNLARDVMFAGVAVQTKEDGAYVKKYTNNITSILVKANLPRLLYKWEHGTLDDTKEIERYFKEFLMNGGETGFTQLNTVEQARRDMYRFLKEAQGGNGLQRSFNTLKKGNRKFWQGVEFLNRAAEDTTRFAVYMTSRQQGRSVIKSINDAKEITVNFNRKGSGAWGARYLNYLYVFFNASMQAVANAGRLVYHHPGKAAMAVGEFMCMGLILPFVNIMLGMLGGGDDDGEDDYWDLPEWVRRNNMVLRIPFTKKFVTIPIAHELRPFYGMGEIAFSILYGKESVEDGLWKAVEGFTGILPIDWTGNGGDAAVNFSPTIAQPGVQVWRNVNYFGKPIYKKTPWNEDDPEWTKAYKGTNGTLVDLTRMLSEGLSTTDEYDVVTYPDKWYTGDINPAVAEHLVESYTGGLGKTINGMAKTLSMLWNEDARELRNVPVLRKFVTQSDESAKMRRLNNDYFKLKEEYDETKDYLKQLRKLDKDGAMGVADRVSRWAASEAGQRYRLLNSYFKQIDGWQHAIERGTDEQKLSQYQHKVDSLKSELVQVNR